jgi:hypothetical protein
MLSIGALPPGSPHEVCIGERHSPFKAIPDMFLRVPRKETPTLRSPYGAPTLCGIDKGMFLLETIYYCLSKLLP